MVLMRKLCLTAMVRLLNGDCLEIRVESTIGLFSLMMACGILL
jgi:hypothetical protein